MTRHTDTDPNKFKDADTYTGKCRPETEIGLLLLILIVVVVGTAFIEKIPW